MSTQTEVGNGGVWVASFPVRREPGCGWMVEMCTWVGGWVDGRDVYVGGWVDG